VLGQKGKRARGQEGKDQREERKEREGTLIFCISGYREDGELTQYPYFQNLTNVLICDRWYRFFVHSGKLTQRPYFLTLFTFLLAILPSCPLAFFN